LLCREEEKRLRHKLAALESKVIVGGENLLERVEEQARLLEETQKELEDRKSKEAFLRQQLQEKEVLEIDSFFSSKNHF
jgi:kinesin family member 3A